MKCIVEGCRRKSRAKKICEAHYRRHRRKNIPIQELDSKIRHYGEGHEVSSGYISVTVNGKLVTQQRVFMSQLLGRPLEKDERVYRRNKNRKDNRLSNLYLVKGKGNGRTKFLCSDTSSDVR